MDESIETIEMGNGYTVKIYQDVNGDNPNPLEDWDHGIHLILTDGRWTAYNNSDVITEHALSDDYFEGWKEIAETVDDAEGAIFVLPVFGGSHGPQVAYSAYGADYEGAIGIAYVTVKDWQMTQGDIWKDTAENRAQCQRLIDGVLEEYVSWCNGECYGYVVTDPNGKEVESCWGFIGDMDYVISEAKSEANADAEAKAKAIDPNGYISTLENVIGTDRTAQL